MRLERLELDGFGVFGGAGWRFGPGVTVLLGDNEAGKTTLLNAIRSILFGFESARGERSWYPALAGGRRGGRLVLVTARGDRWVVQRHGERGGAGAVEVRAPNGNRGGPETLDLLLAGASRDLFTNVFAFGLGELQAFETLSSEGVRGRIYGAGTGLGGRGVLDVERRLGQAQDLSFRPGGRTQPLNVLLARLEEVGGRIAALEPAPQAYDAARRRVTELTAELRAIRAERTALVEERSRLAGAELARGPAAELRRIEAELAAGDPADDRLPPDALADFDRRTELLRVSAAAVAETDAAIMAARRRLGSLPVDRALLEEAPAIEALRDERAAHLGRAGELVELAAEVERRRREVTVEVGRAGPGWDAERLAALDDSSPAIESRNALERRLAAARTALEVSTAQADAAAAELQEHERQLGEVADGREAEAVAERAAALSELAAVRARLAVVEERRLGHLGRRDDLASAAGVTGGSLPDVPALAIAMAAILAGALLGAAFGALAAGSAAGALTGLAAAAGYVVVRRRLAGSSAGQGADRVAALDREINALAGERSALVARAGSLAARAGLSASADDAELSAAAERLALLRARIVAGADLRARVAAMRAAQARRLAERDAHAAEAAHAREAWRTWLADRDIVEGVAPEVVRHLQATGATVRRALAELEAAADRRSRLEDACRSFEGRLDACLARLGRPRPADPGARAVALSALIAGLAASTANRTACDQVEAELHGLRARREAQAAEVARLEAELAAWLERAGVRDEEELRLRAARADTRRAAREAARAAHGQLVVLAGSDAAVADLRARAEELDAAAAAGRAADLERRIAELDERESAHQAEGGALAQEIERLESAEELSRLRAEAAQLRATAAEEARRWAVRAIALRLLQETRSRYERERQPQVVRDAERYFASITGGRYARILALPGEATIRVEEAEGIRQKRVEELSRGTAEQLYLALRFGLIEQFARTAEPLPVVMDDILVNFDEGRAERAAEAIGLLARSHQVIYFTCHPRVAALLDPGGERIQRLA